MTTQSFAQLIEEAEKEGFSNEILPDGPQVLEVAMVRASTSQNGNPQIGVRLKVVGGPLDGKGTWDNININPNAAAISEDDKRKKAIQANGFSFRRLADYGVPASAVASATSVEQIAAGIQVGSRYNAELGHRDHNGKQYQKINKVTALNGASAPVQAPSPAPAAPPVAAAPVSAPAPAPAAPESAPATPAAPPTVPF